MKNAIKPIETTLLEKLPQFYNGDANKYIKSVLLEIKKANQIQKKIYQFARLFQF